MGSVHRACERDGEIGIPNQKSKLPCHSRAEVMGNTAVQHSFNVYSISTDPGNPLCALNTNNHQYMSAQQWSTIFVLEQRHLTSSYVWTNCSIESDVFMNRVINDLNPFVHNHSETSALKIHRFIETRSVSSRLVWPRSLLFQTCPTVTESRTLSFRDLFLTDSLNQELFLSGISGWRGQVASLTPRNVWSDDLLN